MKTRISLLLFVMMFSPFFLYSEAGDNTDSAEQFVYVIESYDGRIYNSTFAFEKINKIYAQGSRPIIFIPVSAKIYFWQTTNDYKLDPEGLKRIQGRLRVRKGKQILFEQEVDEYVLLYRKSGDKTSVEVLLNKEAFKKEKDLEADKAEMDRIYNEYLALKKEYEIELNSFLARLEKIAGQDEEEAQALIETEYQDILKRRPEEPENIIDYYLTPLSAGFVVDLDEGIYEIEFIDTQGRDISGSRRQLTVYSAIDEDRVGYEVAAIDDVKKRYYYLMPDCVIYINGESDLIVNPYYQNLYNDLYILKSLNAQGPGNKNYFRWHTTDKLVNGEISILGRHSNSGEISTYSDYKIIKQFGKTTSFELVSIEVNERDNEKVPDISGYAFSFSDPELSFNMHYTANGSNPASTKRQIRVINQPLYRLWFLLCFVPLIMRIIITLVKRRHGADCN